MLLGLDRETMQLVRELVAALKVIAAELLAIRRELAGRPPGEREP